MHVEIINANDYCQYDLEPCDKKKCLEEDCKRFYKVEKDDIRVWNRV